MSKSSIEKLHKSIAADFKIAARKTQLWEIQYCYDVLHDIKKLMLFGYLKNLSLTMSNVTGHTIKAKRYEFGGTERLVNDRPGTFDWEEGEGHSLNAILVWSQGYQNLSGQQKLDFHQENLKMPWSDVYIDINFPHLKGSLTKQYTHESSGINRIDLN